VHPPQLRRKELDLGWFVEDSQSATKAVVAGIVADLITIQNLSQ
jgi:hypothetical protein